MHRIIIAFFLTVVSLVCAQAQNKPSDPWIPIRFLVGEWTGTASGEPATGTASRQYEFVLGNRFIHEQNTTRV